MPSLHSPPLRGAWHGLPAVGRHAAPRSQPYSDRDRDHDHDHDRNRDRDRDRDRNRDRDHDHDRDRDRDHDRPLTAWTQ